MTTPAGPMEQCQCNIKPNLAKAGEVFKLCQHSPHPDIIEASDALVEILGEFDRRLDIRELTGRPMREALDYYARTVAAGDYAHLNTLERDILAAAFFRHYSITLQAMFADRLKEIKAGEQEAGLRQQPKPQRR